MSPADELRILFPTPAEKTIEQRFPLWGTSQPESATAA